MHLRLIHTNPCTAARSNSLLSQCCFNRFLHLLAVAQGARIQDTQAYFSQIAVVLENELCAPGCRIAALRI